MIETITFYDGGKTKPNIYPKFQTNGNAARFCRPFALEVCKGVGYDIGCGKLEWAFPNSIPVDLELRSEYDYSATNLPTGEVDYIHSSHCLEHLDKWVVVLDYWKSKLKSGGVLFLYLPSYSQHYWRPWNNRKHVNIFTPEMLEDYLSDNGYKNIFVSGVDLYNSFMVMAEKI